MLGGTQAVEGSSGHQNLASYGHLPTAGAVQPGDSSKGARSQLEERNSENLEKQQRENCTSSHQAAPELLLTQAV